MGNITTRVWLPMEEDYQSTLALQNVNSLAASTALKKNLIATWQVSLM
jgi:hypothetical protein